MRRRILAAVTVLLAAPAAAEAAMIPRVFASRSRFQRHAVRAPSSSTTPCALTGAVEDLRGRGTALDVPLGELQAEPRGGERIPIHGCSENEGCFNIISTDRDAQGRYHPFTGASFVMTAAFDERGRVRGEAISRTRSRRTRGRSTTPTRRGCSRRSSGCRCDSASARSGVTRTTSGRW